MKTLLSESQIKDRVSELGHMINAEIPEGSLTVVGVLTGALIFVADLVRNIDRPHKIGLVEASSYRGETTTAGDLAVSTDLLPDIKDRNVLLVDDILDTGNTISAIYKHLQAAGAKEIKTAVLLHKKERQIVPFVPDYVGFEIPDKFVVGYGLDYDDDYRHLPFIAVLN